MANGAEIHGRRVRVTFRWNGARHRELTDYPPTREGLARAERLVAVIRDEISAGNFDLARHFPRSPALAEQSLGHWLDTWLEIARTRVAYSTWLGYRGSVERYLRPRWGDTPASRLDALALESWIAQDLTHLSSKTIRDAVAALRQVYRLYRSRHPEAHDPTAGVRVRLPDRDDPDPFTLAEIERILSHPTPRASERHMAAFLLWTGCRVSEAIALAWEDVDLERGVVRFQRARVRGRWRVTKTRRSTRTHELLSPALEALRAQHALTSGRAPEAVEVVQRDNRTARIVQIRPVFVATSTGRPFYDDFRFRDCFWRTHLAHAGVRYRGPGHCRHTFVSQLLTAEAPIDWIAHQVGHTTPEQIRQRYGRWIADQATSTRATVERALALSPANPRDPAPDPAPTPAPNRQGKRKT